MSTLHPLFCDLYNKHLTINFLCYTMYVCLIISILWQVLKFLLDFVFFFSFSFCLSLRSVHSQRDAAGHTFTMCESSLLTSDLSSVQNLVWTSRIAFNVFRSRIDHCSFKLGCTRLIVVWTLQKKLEMTVSTNSSWYVIVSTTSTSYVGVPVVKRRHGTICSCCYLLIGWT